VGRCALWGIFVFICVGECGGVRSGVYLCFDILVGALWVLGVRR